MAIYNKKSSENYYNLFITKIGMINILHIPNIKGSLQRHSEVSPKYLNTGKHSNNYIFFYHFLIKTQYYENFQNRIACSHFSL